MTPVDIAVIVVSWNTRVLTEQAVRSLKDDLASTSLASRIIVVDNASSDGSGPALKAAFPEIDVIMSDENLGFVRANNLALRNLGFDQSGVDPASLPRAVYLLNPDTITLQGATEMLFRALFADSDVGLTGAALVYGDDSFQHSAFAFPGLRQLWSEFFFVPARWREGWFNGRYSRQSYASSKPFDVDFVLGATMMLRREAILDTGVLDERFFMYCEEIDWAWRLHRAGWRVQCVPAAHVVHLAGQATGQIRAESVRRLWRSRLLLVEKYYPGWKRLAARWIIRTGMQRLARRARRIPDASPELAAAYREVAEWA